TIRCRTGRASPTLPQSRVLAGRCDWLCGRLRALWRDDLSAALPPGREWCFPHEFWSAIVADDPGCTYHFYHQWAAHQSLGSLQSLSDCRHSTDDAGHVPAVAYE